MLLPLLLVPESYNFKIRSVLDEILLYFVVFLIDDVVDVDFRNQPLKPGQNKVSNR